MRHVAVVGTGPAGFYSAEALVKLLGVGVRIDMIDRLPVPYGLIRFGVAPDHQSIKAVSKRYEKAALAGNGFGVPFITLHGRRGGSAMAASAANALILPEN